MWSEFIHNTFVRGRERNTTIPPFLNFASLRLCVRSFEGIFLRRASRGGEQKGKLYDLIIVMAKFATALY